MRVAFCNIEGDMEIAIKDSLQRRGCEVYEFNLTIKDEDYDLEYNQSLINFIEEKAIEMIWSLDYIPIISRACAVMKIPYISWVLRESWDTLYSETIKYPTNFIFIAEENKAGEFYKQNPGHIYYLAPGTFLTQINVESNTIGMCSFNKKISTYYMKKDFSEYMAGYISGLVETQKRVYGYHFVSNILPKKILTELNDILLGEKRGKDYRKKSPKNMVDDFLCDTITRDEIYEIENLMKSQDGIYSGNKISAVNVNVTARKWKSGVPYDMLRVMGAGGFVITNYQVGMEEVFVIGEDIVVYEDYEDLQEKVNYYLTHEEEREIIVNNGRKKVKEHYHLEQRIDDIFYILSNG
jgi:spore maturation protein CgeB